MPGTAPANQAELFRSSALLIRRDANVIAIEQRARLQLVIGLAAVAFALLLLLARFLAGSVTEPHSATGDFMRWATYVLGGLGLLHLVMAVPLARRRSVTFDLNRRVMRRANAEIPFSEVRDVQVATLAIGSTELVMLTTQACGKPLRLVPAQGLRDREALERVATAIRGVLAANAGPELGVATATPATTPATSSLLEQRVIAFVLIAFGVLLAVTGYFLLPDIILTRHDSDSGLLFWPLGLWLAAAGLFEFFGVRLLPRRGAKVTLPQIAIAVVLTVSFAIVCWR